MSVVMGKVLQQERERAGLTQKELARRIHCATSSIGYYETGRNMPNDLLSSAIQVLNSTKLKLQACYECPVNRWATPWLDKVDTHPIVSIKVLKSEMREALEALEKVNLTNKRTADDLTEQDKADLLYATEQVMDCLTAAQMKFGVLQETFGLDVDKASRMHYEKCVERGYLTQQSTQQSMYG